MILYEESKNHPNIQVFFGHKLESIDFTSRKLVFEKSGTALVSSCSGHSTTAYSSPRCMRCNAAI
jgi:hypothetical protein